MIGMSRWLGQAAARVGLWAAATAASAGLVWLGLSPVLRAAVPERVETGNPGDLQRFAQADIGTGPRPTPSVTASASPTATPRPTGRATPKPKPTTTDGWTVVTERDGTTSYLRTFEVAVGVTTIRMTPGKVFLVSATPDPGYTVDTQQPQPDRLVVRFYKTSELFTVDAIWWQSRPYAEVTRTT
jgi:hypothetical protein